MPLNSQKLKRKDIYNKSKDMLKEFKFLILQIANIYLIQRRTFCEQELIMIKFYHPKMNTIKPSNKYKILKITRVQELRFHLDH